MEFLSTFLRAFNPTEPGMSYMWAIVAVGLFGVVIIIERFAFLLLRTVRNRDKLMEQIMAQVSQGNIDGAKKVCEGAGNKILPKILRAGLNEADNGAEKIQNALDEETLTQIPQLDSNTGYLSTVSNVSTLLGLMGTIYGLIVAFAAVGKPGIEAAKKSELLAQGISAAMNTTLLGLAIAIPCILVFAYISSRSQSITDDVEECSIKLLNSLTQRSYKTLKYHIKTEHIQDGVGLHITNKNIKIFTNNKLLKEINL